MKIRILLLYACSFNIPSKLGTSKHVSYATTCPLWGTMPFSTVGVRTDYCPAEAFWSSSISDMLRRTSAQLQCKYMQNAKCTFCIGFRQRE